MNMPLLDIDKITDIEFGGIDHRDCPDYSDAYISEAWIFEGKEFRALNDNELEWLNSHENASWFREKLEAWLH